MAAEMATFVILVLPLPFTVRKKLFTFLSENPLIAKVSINTHVIRNPAIHTYYRGSNAFLSDSWLMG